MEAIGPFARQSSGNCRCRGCVAVTYTCGIFSLSRFITHTREGRHPVPVIAWLGEEALSLTRKGSFAGIAHACLQQQKVHCAVTHPRQRLGRTGEVVEHSIAVHHVVLVRFCWEIAVEI